MISLLLRYQILKYCYQNESNTVNRHALKKLTCYKNTNAMETINHFGRYIAKKISTPPSN